MTQSLIPSLRSVDDRHLEANVRAIYAGGFNVANMTLDVCLNSIARGQWARHSLYLWHKPYVLDITTAPCHPRYTQTNSASHFIAACRAPNTRSQR